MAITPDGTRALSGAGDNTLRLWDLATGKTLAVWIGHTDPVYTVEITSDGTRALSGSGDNTLRLWDFATGKTLAVLEGHTRSVMSMPITPDGTRALSGAHDKTLRLWDLTTGETLAVWGGELKGCHSGPVYTVAITPDGTRALSGAGDNTLRLWNLADHKTLAVLEGHTDSIYTVAITPNGTHALSGSGDNTLRLWDLATGKALAVWEGHTDAIMSVAITPDGTRAISGARDNTLRLWDLATGKTLAAWEGHTGPIYTVAITPDGTRALSGAGDNTLRLWDLSHLPSVPLAPASRYVNAKVVLVGESGVGKTGLAMRLARNHWEPTESTHGMTISQLAFSDHTPQQSCSNPEQSQGVTNAGIQNSDSDLQREVWLWDFAGQPDYRLIHQLSMDQTALALFVFDPQQDNPFDSLVYWDKAITKVAREIKLVKLLVAARCDRGGTTVSDHKLQQFCEERNFACLIRTEAKSGKNCDELKALIAEHLPWTSIPYVSTSTLFKTLKDAITDIRSKSATDSTQPILIRFVELHQRLQLLLPNESFSEAELRTVVSLLAGQGLIAILSFGDIVLLQPERLNAYASAIVRAARDSLDKMGTLSEHDVLEARIDFKDLPRLKTTDEHILLQEIVHLLLKRAICMRERTVKGDMLVFPSYFSRERSSEISDHPNVLFTYTFDGPVEEVYSTLVVRLCYSDLFEFKELWKNAVDFHAPGGKRMGIKLTPKKEGSAELTVFFESKIPLSKASPSKVSLDIQALLKKLIHEHLHRKALHFAYVRTFTCPRCDHVVVDQKAIEVRRKSNEPIIPCQYCNYKIPLVDAIEVQSTSVITTMEAAKVTTQIDATISSEARGQLGEAHTKSIAAEANQIYREYNGPDHGIDAEIEFRNNNNQASGKRVYLQIKSGDSHLKKRKKDGQEIFHIENSRHAQYWQSQPCPVYLVIRTSDARIRWMNITEHLKVKTKETGKLPTQIVFFGEPFTAASLRHLCTDMLTKST
ncbi:MAG: DUF4365 domain-containing protein [Phycisphaerales bacterium]|nr:DUF4365 domain-containing protein [Phycisphaerales bacterium]